MVSPELELDKLNICACSKALVRYIDEFHNDVISPRFVHDLVIVVLCVAIIRIVYITWLVNYLLITP